MNAYNHGQLKNNL
jgi:hypothetical protein